MMMGATPPKLVYWGSVTLITMPAATPRVNGVAALLENPVAAAVARVVTGADHVGNAADEGTVASKSDGHNNLPSR